MTQFIGGPLDGEPYNLPEETNEFHYAIPPKYDFAEQATFLSQERTTLKVAIYERLSDLDVFILTYIGAYKSG